MNHYLGKTKLIAWILSICLVITLIPDIGYATGADVPEQNANAVGAESLQSEDETLLESEGAGEPDVIETATDQQEPDEEALAAVNDPAMEGLTEEDVIEKTETTTTYDIGDGLNARVLHGGQVRFEDEDGELIDYDPSLVKIKEGEKSDEDTSLEGYEYRNKTGDKKQYLPERLTENTPILMEYEGYSISLIPTAETVDLLGLGQAEAAVREEIVPTIYEGEGESVPVDAVYGSSDDAAVLTYTSGMQGSRKR